MKIFKISSEDIDLSFLQEEDINYLKYLDDDYLTFKDCVYELLLSYISKIYFDRKDYIEIDDLNSEFSEEDLQSFIFAPIGYQHIHGNYYICINLKVLVERIIEYIND